MKHGKPHECHSNAADLWAKGTDKYRLVTGYALMDNHWVSHSWVVDDKKLYETTHRFDLYFGAELAPLLAFRFWVENVLAKFEKGWEPPPGFLEKRQGIVALAEAVASMPKEEFYRQLEECSKGLCA
jgi:hypothetical protein